MSTETVTSNPEMDTSLILDCYDPSGEFITSSVAFQTTNLDDLARLLDLEGFDVSAVYDLEEEDLARLRRHFAPDIPLIVGFARLRPRLRVDDLPYTVHTNRELPLMLAGTKPLSVFCEPHPSFAECSSFPEKTFDRHVENGELAKRDWIDCLKEDKSRELRWVFYALPSEAWRIDAYILLLKTVRRSGWCSGFLRMEGTLLGYQEWENDAFQEMEKAKGQV